MQFPRSVVHPIRLVTFFAVGSGATMQWDDNSDAVRELVERLPQWLPADLSANGIAARTRAEDVLRAMIVAAVSAASATGARL